MEALPLAAAMLGGVDVSAAVILSFSGDFERKVIEYTCDDDTALQVTYVNAAPNFLAILPIEGQKLVFVTQLSGSGARYVVGEYVWWTKGPEATLTSVAAPDAKPLTCTEHSETP